MRDSMHQERRIVGATERRSGRTSRRRRGFSLVEMLFAIFLLGIGVISVASLFPVGLTQQRRSADDIMGPTIANNALEVLRSKLSPSDFGYLNVSGPPFDDGYATIQGDFRWRRPAFDNNNGLIDVFFGSNDAYGRSLGAPGGYTNSEVPYSLIKYPDNPGPQPPRVIFTQVERYYPQQIPSAGNRPPQYVWDCAFRRFQGRIQVAIFVYRVSGPGGEPGAYVVAPNPNSGSIPPLPHYNLLDGTGDDASWDVDMNGDTSIGNAADAIVPGTAPATPYDAENYDQGWQAPGQWILDQNNNIHRVLSGRRNESDGPVELTRPPQGVPFIPVFSFAGAPSKPVFELFYIPPVDSNGWSLTPVYVTVREL